MPTTQMTFTEAMATDPPRLVVLFQRGPDGNERFQWGVVHEVPVLTLIGAIVRVQSELPLLEPGDARHDCPREALVLSWNVPSDPAIVLPTNTLHWFVHKDIPIDQLVGMLETIKVAMVTGRMGQRAAADRILGPDGNPMRG